MATELVTSTRQSQRQMLSQRLLNSVRLLEMSLPALRGELYEEMSRNPVIEDVEATLEKDVVSDKARESEREADAVDGDYPEDETDFGDRDAERVERRMRFLESRTRGETLEEHLNAQLAVSGFDEADRGLAERLIGELDDDGRFIGSIPDLVMTLGVDEGKIAEILGRIAEFDPPGCGAVDLKGCLVAQLDKIEDSAAREDVRALVENHLDDIAGSRWPEILAATGMDRGRLDTALRQLRTLDPKPGRAFDPPGRGETYVNPEVHSVFRDGRWRPQVDERSLPEIHISPRYLKMLEDPATDAETRAYIKERVASAKAVIEAVAERQHTVVAIAEAIFARQQRFFVDGAKALAPMTMQEIADEVGVSVPTVSRTVRDKYAETPQGTIELRKFFTSGTGGVMEELKTVIEGENSAKPLSDEAISAELKRRGYDVARRTVAKYRNILGIMGVAQRRKK